MSRYRVTVNKGAVTDDNATIGYDRPLRTFFLTAFFEDEPDVSELWLGAYLEENPTLESLVRDANERGFTISGLRHKNMIAMLAEAGQPAPPSIAEIVGLVR